MNAAGITRRLHLKSPCAIRAQYITLQDAINYDITRFGCNAFAVKSRAAHRAHQHWLLMNTDKIRKDLLAQVIKKK